MPNKTIHLAPAGIKTSEGWDTLTWRIHRSDAPDLTLLHSLPVENTGLFVSPTRGDHALIATLLWAMQHKFDIRVEGEVSPLLLTGLETLQEIWHRWAPRRYQRIEIHATAEEPMLPAQATSRAGLFAFSGGVDASFTLFRHLHNKAGRNTIRPTAALLVQGMDIPLHDEASFIEATARAERMLTPSALPLIRMRTNTRSLKMDWEDTFGLQLFACFLAIQPQFSHALHGSGEPYETLVLPWGATPLTDPLCSTECMSIVHDGCAFDRTEKVDWLATNTEICDQLRVCWEGDHLGKNCGECEKCLRTMLNFWAKGHPPSAAFPASIDSRKISAISVRNTAQLRELQSILRHASTEHPPQDPILKAINKLVFQSKIRSIKKRASSFLKSLSI